MNSLMHSHFEALFRPRSVAVIGASDNPNKVGGRPIHYLNRFGFEGKVFPVNPARAEIQGHRAYASVQDICEVPDAVVIAVSGEAALAQVRQCSEIGVKAAVVMASGFGETGEAGRQRQDELVTAANAGGMRLVGPNAQGTANFASGAVLNFSTMFMEVAPADGPIAIISQSGAASVMPYALLRQAGLGVRYLVATGNDADIDACAMAEAVAADPAIRLILVYLESLSSPVRLAAAAAVARQRGAHVVVLKSGSSQRGAVAAASHTGAMVGNDATVDAFLARHGIWRARDMNEFIRATALYLQGHDAAEGRTVVMSHSGAVGVMSADLAEQAGLPLTELAPATQDSLAAILPDFGSANNPLDMTAALLGKGDMFPRVLDALGSDPEADMVMIGIPVAGPGYDVDALARHSAAFLCQHAKPLIISAPQQSVREVFAGQGIPTYITEADAIAALSQYAGHRRLSGAVSILPSPAPLAYAGNGLLDEHASLALLSEHGVPVVAHRQCANGDEAAAAFAALGGGAMVVKGCAASVPHKSEHGLVRLGLTDADSVRAAAEACLEKLVELDVATPRVVVGQMVRGRHEFALGVTVDPALGPLLMIGEGGTLLELRKDIVTLLAPFGMEEARAACRRLRLAPLFDGYRDMPALDLEALASAAVALGNFALVYRNSLKAVDINPLMVMPAGQGVVAVDAVVEMT